MTARIHLPIGIDDFQALRRADVEYVDKTHLVREVLDLRGTQVLVLPRPRRFGKTLNLSMLRYYFERSSEDRSVLFQDLSIWGAGDLYRAHFGRYPVIFLSFKGIKHDNVADCIAGLRQKLQVLYGDHRYLLEGATLHEDERRSFQAVLNGSASDVIYATSLLTLSRYLQRLTGQPAVILVDEYDEPLHTAYFYGYTDQLLPFYRILLTDALKGNPHLFKAVLTGVLRVARESIFSDLNNPGVYTLLRQEFNTCFGFTEPEVEALLHKLGQPRLIESIRAWYNGYLFGGVIVYNPWSLMSFLSSLDQELRGYWTRTSSNDLVRQQLQQRALEVEPAMEELLAGRTIERALEEDTVLSELATRERSLWSLLVFTGYLRAQPFRREPGGDLAYRLSIPNREIREVFVSTFSDWLAERLRLGGGSLERLVRALLQGDAEALALQLQAFVTNLLSYHDLGSPPEQLYQGFIIGLLAALEPTHQVRSNRESGNGRPDVQILPRQPGQPGVVLELKVARAGKKSPTKALAEGLAQLKALDYRAELVERGAAPIHAFAIALRGKHVFVKKG